MAHGTTEPEEEEPPPPLPPRQPYAAAQRQQTMPNSPIIQKSAYPRSHGISQSNTPTSSPVMTSSTVRSPPSVVGTQSMFSQPVVSSKSCTACWVFMYSLIITHEAYGILWYYLVQQYCYGFTVGWSRGPCQHTANAHRFLQYSFVVAL